MTDTPTFESALGEIEQILRILETGTATLEESLTSYERGVELLKTCYGHLRTAEARVRQLAGVDAEGKPILEPFEHTASDSITGETRPKSSRAKAKDKSGLY